MKKVLDGIRKFRDFLGEVRNELRKSSWPLRGELLESTIVLVISVILFSVFIGLSDTLLMNVVRLLIR